MPQSRQLGGHSKILEFVHLISWLLVRVGPVVCIRISLLLNEQWKIALIKTHFFKAATACSVISLPLQTVSHLTSPTSSS